jgi:hypothetical protein
MSPRRRFFVIQIGFAASALLAASGCGNSTVQSSAGASPVGGSSGPMQMRAKLNAMSVPDRMAYIKAHPEAVREMSGGGASPSMAKQAGQ